MMENLIEESIKTEKMIMNLANEVYPDKDSLFSIKKRVEIIDKNKIIRKKKKIILNTPSLSMINGEFNYIEKLNNENVDLPTYEKISIEIHDDKQKQIRIFKFKIGFSQN